VRTQLVTLAAVLVCAATGSVAETPPSQGATPAGAHDFDFLVGEWQVHHRVKRPTDGGKWTEFEGTCVLRLLMGGSANVEDHVFNRPNGVTRAVGVRSYDAQSGEWAIWWIDSRVPHGALDPPTKGRFDRATGVGTFYADVVLDGKPMRTRFIWSRITPTSARWEQAYSYDAGKTWDTNWIMDWQRVAAR
jgi:hypothetical protein